MVPFVARDGPGGYPFHADIKTSLNLKRIWRIKMKTKFHLRISLLLAVLSVAFVLAACGDDDDDDDDASSGGYTDVSVTEAKELIDELNEDR